MKRRKKPERVSQSLAFFLGEETGGAFSRLTITGVEAFTGEALGDVLRIGRVGSVGVEGGRQGGAEREPEAAEGAEDDKGEGVAEEEFEDAAQTHQEPADEVIGAYRRDASLARAPPAHQLAR